MNRFATVVYGIASLAFMVSGARPDELDVVPFSERAELLAAMRVEDPEDRVRAVDDVLFEVLIRGDIQKRFEAKHHIGQLSRWYDFRPHEPVFYQLLLVHEDQQLLDMLDIEDLLRGDRQERVAILKRALVEGDLQLGRGRPFGRVNAIPWVGREGITELRSLAEQFYPTLSAGLQEWYPLEKFRLELELAEGALDGREDVLAKTVEHLLSVGSSELQERAEASDLFAQIIVERARQACEPNPIDYSRNKACDLFYKLWERQSAYLAKSEGYKARSEDHDWERPEGWLEGVYYYTMKARTSKPILPLPVATPKR